MRETLRQLVTPVLLFLCLILGGSSQSVWGVLVLQILSIFVIAWALVFSIRNTESTGRGLLALLLAGLILIGIQLVPLPPALWNLLPGRDLVERGYRALDQQLPWLPISLTPYATLATLLLMLPPVAIILAVLRLRAYRESWVAAALFAGTMLGVLLGFAQLITSQFGHSGWYLYEQTNVGSAVGFFANRNHMGTLLLMTFPFVVALFLDNADASSRHAASLAIIGVAGVVAILLGIAVNGSVAAVALAVPVVAMSALLVPGLGRFRSVLLAAGSVGLIGALIFLANSPVHPKLTGESTASFEGRWEIWERTWSAMQGSFPVGTGLGSFERVYAGVEPARNVASVYVNHAHNDYLEFILETGLPGAILIVAFFTWWIGQVGRTFASPLTNRFSAAATIASGVALAHSVVDYPLRTTSIAATFAFCVAVMATPGRRQSASKSPGPSGLRSARHVVIG